MGKVLEAAYSSPLVKEYIEGLKGKDDTFFYVEGVWCLDYLLKSKIEVAGMLYAPEYINNEATKENINKFLDKDIDVVKVSKKVFDRVSTFDGPDGVIIKAKIPCYDLEKLSKGKNNLIVVLDGLETPGNIGTIIRAGEGMQATAIFVTNRRAKVHYNKTIKSAMGGYFFTPVIEFENVKACQEWLKKHNYKVYLTDTRAKNNYFEPKYEGNVAFVAGAERYGIDRSWYNNDNELIKIPMLGNCDSLNVAVSTCIVMCEIAMKLQGIKEK